MGPQLKKGAGQTPTAQTGLLPGLYPILPPLPGPSSPAWLSWAPLQPPLPTSPRGLRQPRPCRRGQGARVTGRRVAQPPGTLHGLGRGPPSVRPQSPRLPATHRSGTPATRLAAPPNGAHRAQASTPPHPPAVHPPGQRPTSPRDKVPRTPSEAPGAPNCPAK